MVVAAIVFAFLIAGIRIFGVQVYGVLTGSMEPTYPTGSMIYVKDVKAEDLRVNDVITFSISPGVIATHRIVEVVPDEQNPTIMRYRTKGDANKDVDAGLVSANNIIGKAIFVIPQMGYVANYIQQPPGIYIAIVICGLMIAFVFYTDSLEEKQRKQAQQPMAARSGFDLAALVNQASEKLLGKSLIKSKTEPEPLVQRGYVPPKPVQQPGYPAQYPMQNATVQYPQQGYQPGYPQQPMGYQQQVQAYPELQQGYYPQQMQQSYPQQPYAQQGYPQQPYAQQGYYPQQAPQPGQYAPQPYYPQQPYAAQRNPGAVQQNQGNGIRQ